MDRKIQKRSTIRARTTVILEKIDIETAKQDSAIDSSILEEYYEQLVSKETSLKELDDEIEELTLDLGELETEINTAQEYEEEILSGKSKVSKKIKELNSAASTVSGVFENNQPIVQGQLKATVKLPRLTLNKFSGDTTDWLRFWGQFESAIHTNGSLRKIDKLNYLLSYLEGVASSAVSGLSLTEDSYDVAIELLRKRFGKRDL